MHQSARRVMVGQTAGVCVMLIPKQHGVNRKCSSQNMSRSSQRLLSCARIASVRGEKEGGGGVRKRVSHVEAPRALDIHEVAVWRGDEALHLVHALLHRGRGVKQVTLHLRQGASMSELAFTLSCARPRPSQAAEH